MVLTTGLETRNVRNVKDLCAYHVQQNQIILILQNKGHTVNERIDIEEQRVLVWLMVFNATFNNISVISWRSVLLVEETGVP